MNKTVVFVTSMSFSGSTVLDLILGGHPRLVGLGEVHQVVKDGAPALERPEDFPCSCGQAMAQCEFWGQVCSRLRTSRSLTTRERYRLVFDSFWDVFGDARIPVDSSKYIPAIQLLCRIEGIDTQVIHLIRDVRAFCISQIDSLARHKPPDLLRGAIYRTPAYHFWRWYTWNRRIQRFLEREHIRSFQLGYEELTLYPDLMIEKICDFLGERSTPSMLSLATSGSHSVLGNRMRHQPEKRRAILYDNRWFYRDEWFWTAALFRRIMKYNAREVYGNETGKIWTK